jgi:hypothetical protein
MPKVFARLGFAALLVLAAAAPLHAQALTPGTWTGTIAPPNTEAIPLQLEVSGAGAALAVSVTSSLIPGAIPLNDIRVDGDSVTFWWDLGARVECTLTRDASGGYAGPCSAGGAPENGRMTMVPPAGE